MKPMAFEEWYDSDEQTFGQCWDAARIGMIPEDEAIRIPPESEWPKDANGIRVHYTFPHVDYSYGTGPIKIIPRSKPAWVPKVGEPVFTNMTKYPAVMRVECINGEGIELRTQQGFGLVTGLGNLKPFNPAYIGKPWSEIPEGKDGN